MGSANGSPHETVFSVKFRGPISVVERMQGAITKTTITLKAIARAITLALATEAVKAISKITVVVVIVVAYGVRNRRMDLILKVSFWKRNTPSASGLLRFFSVSATNYYTAVSFYLKIHCQRTRVLFSHVMVIELAQDVRRHCSFEWNLIFIKQSHELH